jgi:hypothetical protein
MIDREELQDQMVELRDDLVRRQRDLETDHAAIMEQTHEALARARAAEPTPLTYKQTNNGADYGGGDYAEPEPFSDEALDILAQAIADLRAEMRGEIEAAVEAATRPLRERLATLEGQIATMLALLGDRAPELRLSPPIERPRLLE